MLLQIGLHLRISRPIDHEHTDQIVTNCVAREGVSRTKSMQEPNDAHDKNHFLLQLPIIIVFWTHFPVEVEELFQRLVFGREYVLDDWH